MRIYLIGFIGLVFTAQAYAFSISDLGQIVSQNQAQSPTQTHNDLRSILEQSARLAVEQLGQPGGFSSNPKVQISLPGNLGKAAQAMKMLGQGQQVAALEASMNSAAEKAIPQAQVLLLDAIKNMSLTDAKDILTGPEDSATSYIARSSRDQLRNRFLPIIQQATKTSNLAQQYNNFATQAANYGAIDAKDASLESYVTEQTLNGLFSVMAEKESAIRQNPGQAAGDIAEKVFEFLR